MKLNVLYALTLFVMFGCSDDVPTENIISVNSSAFVGENKKDLPVCSAQNSGQVAYVVESGELLYCVDNEWESSIQNGGARDTVYIVDSLSVVKKVFDSVYVENARYVKNSCMAEADTSNYHVTKVTCGESTFYVENRLAHLISTKYGEELVDSRDGKKYRTVVIGKQTWMAENLQYEMWGSSCVSDSADYCEKYGRVYEYGASKQACPEGWHLPDRSEIKELIAFVDSHNGAYSATQDLVARDVWRKGDKAYDVFGFSILPAGYRDPQGRAYPGQETGFWIATDVEGSYYNSCWLKEFGSIYTANDRYTLLEKQNNCDTKNQLSVRCLKNEK